MKEGGGRGAVLERGVSKLFYQFFFRKTCFHNYWNTFFFFFCLVNMAICKPWGIGTSALQLELELELMQQTLLFPVRLGP